MKKAGRVRVRSARGLASGRGGWVERGWVCIVSCAMEEGAWGGSGNMSFTCACTYIICTCEAVEARVSDEWLLSPPAKVVPRAGRSSGFESS